MLSFHSSSYRVYGRSHLLAQSQSYTRRWFESPTRPHVLICMHAWPRANLPPQPSRVMAIRQPFSASVPRAVRLSSKSFFCVLPSGWGLFVTLLLVRVRGVWGGFALYTLVSDCTLHSSPCSLLLHSCRWLSREVEVPPGSGSSARKGCSCRLYSQPRELCMVKASSSPPKFMFLADNAAGTCVCWVLPLSLPKHHLLPSLVSPPVYYMWASKGCTLCSEAIMP